MLLEFDGAYYEPLSLAVVRTYLGVSTGKYPKVEPGYPAETDALQEMLFLAREPGGKEYPVLVLDYPGRTIAVQDAHALVRRHAHWITPSRGGRGAAREACELILHAQGSYAAEMQRYLRATPEAAA